MNTHEEKSIGINLKLLSFIYLGREGKDISTFCIINFNMFVFFQRAYVTCVVIKKNNNSENPNHKPTTEHGQGRGRGQRRTLMMGTLPWTPSGLVVSEA